MIKLNNRTTHLAIKQVDDTVHFIELRIDNDRARKEIFLAPLGVWVWLSQAQYEFIAGKSDVYNAKEYLESSGDTAPVEEPIQKQMDLEESEAESKKHVLKFDELDELKAFISKIYGMDSSAAITLLVHASYESIDKFRKALQREKELPTFKVGDRVRINKPTYINDNNPVMFVCEVKENNMYTIIGKSDTIDAHANVLIKVTD